MGFTEFAKREFEIVCDIAYGSLKQRAPLPINSQSPRNLELICDGFEFFTKINGNLYCSLGSFNSRNINCRYLCQDIDPNGNRTCSYANKYGIEIVNKAKS